LLELSERDGWSGAVLRIISQKKSIDAICAKIDTPPTRYYEKGELYSKRNPNSRIREENIWILNSLLDRKAFPDIHIKYLVSVLRKNSNGVKELQQECGIDIMCAYSYGNGYEGFTLNHALLKELSEYSVELIINLYPPGPNALGFEILE
jgi:hypothetical protein